MKFFLYGLIPGLLLISCTRNSSKQNVSNEKGTYNAYDTIVEKCIEYPGFQFYIKSVSGEFVADKDWFCSVHINKTDKNHYLFYTHAIYIDEFPLHIYEDFYIWPFWSGGNGHWSVGENVFKINGDTAFALGCVSHYEDITDDNIPELYTRELIEYGSARAFDKFQNIIVTIENDSLSFTYPPELAY